MRTRLAIPIGAEFGRLVVLREGERAGDGKRQIVCRCSCGATKSLRPSDLATGRVISCGCALRDSGRITIVAAQDGARTHGLTRGQDGRRHPLWSAWVNMRQRCSAPGATSYEYYGARGVRVCERWDKDFAAFVADIGPRPSPQHTIERIDNAGHYEPGNVRWATMKEQAANRRWPRRRSPAQCSA